MKLKQWQFSLREALDAIIPEVEDFADNYEGTLIPDKGEEEEFHRLLKPAYKVALSPKELDRQQDLAGGIIEDCMKLLMRHNVDSPVVEIVSLISWLKVSALAGDKPEETYFTVRRSIPHVTDSYDAIARAILER